MPIRRTIRKAMTVLHYIQSSPQHQKTHVARKAIRSGMLLQAVVSRYSAMPGRIRVLRHQKPLQPLVVGCSMVATISVRQRLLLLDAIIVRHPARSLPAPFVISVMDSYRRQRSEPLALIIL